MPTLTAPPSVKTQPAFADLVSGDAMKTTDVTAERISVFVQVPLEAMLHAPALARVLIGSLMNAMFIAESKTRPVLLDEAARLGRMKELEVARDIGRKYGVVLSLYYQSIGQMDGV